MAEEIERIYIIPLKKTGFKSSKAAPSAVKRVKGYLTKHMKVEEKDIWIDDSLNNALWSQGKFKMASKIRVKAVKFDDGVVEAYLPELEFKKSRRELLKEEKAKKEPILKKEEMEEEAEGETGAEDYEIAPAADGDVKIKKKKTPKLKKGKKPTEKKPVKAKKKQRRYLQDTNSLSLILKNLKRENGSRKLLRTTTKKQRDQSILYFSSSSGSQ